MTRALALLLVIGGVAHADGGALVLSRASGPFVFSVFAAPVPLRAGLVDVSVLVQSRDGNAVVLDAEVALCLRAPDGSEQRRAASHDAATNRLLQAATVDLRPSGRWRLDVTARRGDAVATVGGALDVAAASPRLAGQWPALALPAVCVLLFAWRERSRGRSSTAVTAAGRRAPAPARPRGRR